MAEEAERLGNVMLLRQIIGYCDSCSHYTDVIQMPFERETTRSTFQCKLCLERAITLVYLNRRLPGRRELAQRIVNLRRTLKVCYDLLHQHVPVSAFGLRLLPGYDELARPSFKEGASFWAEVSRVLRGIDERQYQKSRKKR